MRKTTRKKKKRRDRKRGRGVVEKICLRRKRGTGRGEKRRPRGESG